MCLRIIFNMYINDGQISQINKGHRITLTYLEYGSIFEIFTPIYTQNYLLNFIYSHLYIVYIYIYTNTSGCSPYYKYFHTTMHSIKGEEVKIIIRGTVKIHVLCL